MTAPTRTLSVPIGNRNYDITSDDRYLDHIASGAETGMLTLFGTLTQDQGTVLDVGANIGCTALYFSDHAKIVHAFEPSPTTALLLSQNLRNNQKSNVMVHNVGLGETAFDTTLTFASNNRSGGFVSNQTSIKADHTTESICIVRADDYVEALNIDLIHLVKVDVEGFEGSVLRGAKKTLTKYQPIVVLELNHWCLNAFQRTSVPDFFDLLRSIFPLLYAVDDLNMRRADLHNQDSSYRVMYEHILHGRWPNIVAAYHKGSLTNFLAQYHGS
jgi:FkbM family methyltransferase